MMDKLYGAIVERGTVQTVINNAARVKSLDRPGVLSLTMTVPDGVSAGDTVYFTLFPDGTGAILGASKTSEEDDTSIYIGLDEPETPTDGMVWIMPNIGTSRTYTVTTDAEKNFGTPTVTLTLETEYTAEDPQDTLTYTVKVPVSVKSGTVSSYVHATLSDGENSVYLGYVTASGASGSTFTFKAESTVWLCSGTELTLTMHCSSKADNTTDAVRSGIVIQEGSAVNVVCRTGESTGTGWKSCTVRYYKA